MIAVPVALALDVGVVVVRVITVLVEETRAVLLVNVAV